MTATLLSFEEALERFDPALGLEVHVELNTASKMFCGCATEFGAEPNTQVCPTCLGLPGAMPVVNGKAVESAIRIGLALNCEIAEWCRFARKNYFYPDMPKNFQTSQYDEPIAFEGFTECAGRRHADLSHRHRARPHGGGHRQVAARRRLDRPHPRRRLLAGRLQPGRHPADRDRHQADHRHRGRGTAGGEGVRRSAARPAAGAGCLRRPDGAGLAALRREPLAGAEGLRRARHPHRDQERELAAVGRAGGALRDAAARRRALGRRHDPPGDAALARGHRRHHQRPGEVGRRGLPLLPRARPGAGGADARVGRGAARRASRGPGEEARAAAGRVGLLRPRDARHRRRGRSRAGRGDHRGRRLARRPPASGGSPTWRVAPTTPASTSRPSA